MVSLCGRYGGPENIEYILVGNGINVKIPSFILNNTEEEQALNIEQSTNLIAKTLRAFSDHIHPSGPHGMTNQGPPTHSIMARITDDVNEDSKEWPSKILDEQPDSDFAISLPEGFRNLFIKPILTNSLECRIIRAANSDEAVGAFKFYSKSIQVSVPSRARFVLKLGKQSEATAKTRSIVFTPSFLTASTYKGWSEKSSPRPPS